MPYKAYKDTEKTQLIYAKDATIQDVGKIFYCSTPNCPASMSIVSAASSERAYFRTLKKSKKHINQFCVADGAFNPIKYKESSFNFDDVSKKLMIASTSSSKNIGKGNSIVSGGGGEKPISTVNQIYYMCRKYHSYNGYSTNQILADERSFKIYKNGIEGNKVVQCTPFHKFKDEYAYRMNYPSFPYNNGKHIKLNFYNEELYWNFHNKVKFTNHKNLIIVLGNWSIPPKNDFYISECTICNNRQIHFLPFSK
ncbi:hypothetical protein [Miniphocaeibacter massiliensis]|uniref:hypothetical protein n=1 Tax=Miniphocaeibacter massiliensis TaxID=2041841 RepID=UPI000C1BED04|nr:hypothetical protein [Miniphocaeibacter massiliensis]